MYTNIVLPIHPDHMSVKAFRHAFGLAARSGGKVTIVRASPKVFDDDQEMMLRVSLDTFHEDENEVIRGVGEAVSEMLAKPEVAEFAQKVPHEIKVIADRNNADKSIVEFAKDQDADLIVVSLRGRSPALHILFGNFKEWVIHYANCPVLVIHEN